MPTKFEIQIWVLNFCWQKNLPLAPRNYFLLAPTRISVGIFPLAPRNYFLLAPTWVFVGIGDPRRFFSGIPLCFPLLGFTMLLLSWGTKYLRFVRNYTNHQKDKIAYVPLDQFSDYVYIVDLNNRLHVGWKTLPNLNPKLRFQTQTSNSNLNFGTKIFPVIPGNPGLW